MKNHVPVCTTPPIQANRSLPSSRLLVAVLISLLIHLGLVLTTGQFSSGTTAMGAAAVQVTLSPSARAAPPGENAVEPAAASSDAALVSSAPSPARLPARKPPRPRNDRPQASPAPVVVQTPSPTPSSGQPTANDQNTTAASVPGTSGRVSRAAIRFDVFSGPERRLIASGEHLYVSASNDQFGISVRPDAGAGEATTEDRWHIEVSGRINSQGLSPFLYETQGALSQRLMSIKTGSAGNPAARKWRVPDGIIDRQTLLYYFMLKPPELMGGKVLLSDGASHAVFSYRFGGIESFTFPSLGTLSAVRLVFSTPESAETIELWVVPDLHHLPVKVRTVDKLGVITEQAATSLDVR